MHPITNARERKPRQCPPELKKFEWFFNRLPQRPLGPKYLGMFEYDIKRITKDERIDIREMEVAGFKAVDISEHYAVVEGRFIRAEAIVLQFPKDKRTKYWKRQKKNPYISKFEKQFNTTGGHKGLKILYKDFVVWATEFGYEDHQIGAAMGIAAPTARIYRNQYGYRDFVAIRTKTPNLKGKINRTEIVEGEKDIPNGVQVKLDFDHSEVKSDGKTGARVPRSVKEKDSEADKIYAFSTDRLVNELNRRGYKVSLTK